jgi:hypothetical protein
MLLAHVALVAALSVTPAREPYEGPLGLKWGQSKKAVLSALAGRFTLREGKADRLLVDGDFAGFKTDGVFLFFKKGGLVSVFVVLQRNDERARSRVWRDVVVAMVEAYGLPDEPEIPIPPSLASLSYDALDVAIRSGNWTPRVTWVFPNEARSTVSVQADRVDQNGKRLLDVTWSFVDRSAWAKSDDTGPATPRDF